VWRAHIIRVSQRAALPQEHQSQGQEQGLMLCSDQLPLAANPLTDMTRTGGWTLMNPIYTEEVSRIASTSFGPC
jgi:hypothetical protein